MSAGDRSMATPVGDSGRRPPARRPPGRGRRLLVGAGRLLLTAAVSGVLAYLVMAYLAQTFRIVGSSMEPALLPGERVLVVKVGGPIARGDIVVFRDPVRGETRIVKRVLAIPGDRVQVRGGEARLLRESARRSSGRAAGLRSAVPVTAGSVLAAAAEPPPADLRPSARPSERRRRERPPESIREGHYFVLGDNRARSRDSRHWGQLAEEAVVGRAVLRVWPPRRFGRIEPGLPGSG